MAFFTNVAVLLVVACVSHQLVSGGCQRGHGRRGRAADRGQRGDRSGPKSVSSGRVVTQDGSECTWAATGGDDALLVLGVACRREGVGTFSCEYVAEPSLCPGHASHAGSYWRQTVRAMRRQRTLCQEGGAVLKAGVCRRAPAEAHFRLRKAQKKKKKKKKTGPPPTPPTPPPPPPATATATATTCRHANKKLAEEYCDDSWSSFCTLLFTMVQDYDC